MNRLAISTWRSRLRSSIPLAALHTNRILTAQNSHQHTPRLHSANHTIGMNNPPLYTETDPFPEQANAQNDTSRPGIFGGLHNFLQVQGAFSGTPDYMKYREVEQVKPEPGVIIHIVNGGTAIPARNSPVDQRVMLVVRQEHAFAMTPRAMTCVPLCFHVDDLPRDDKQHWVVKQEFDSPPLVGHPDQPRQSRKGMPKVCQALVVTCERDYYLQQGITVNLGELWHVEYDHIHIDKIGQVTNSSGEAAFRRAAALFKESMEESCRKLISPVEEKPTTPQNLRGWTRSPQRRSLTNLVEEKTASSQRPQGWTRQHRHHK